MESTEKKEKLWHELFKVGVYIKGIIGAFELASGFLVIFISAERIGRILANLANRNLPLNLEDFFVYFSHQYVANPHPELKIFAGLYIISRGVINMFLVWGLIKERHEAYLFAIGVMGSFWLYQVYRLVLHPSLLLGFLTAFDVLLIILIWHEYKKLKASKKIVL